MTLEAHVLRTDVEALEADLTGFLATRGVTAANIAAVSTARDPAVKGEIVVTVVADTGA